MKKYLDYIILAVSLVFGVLALALMAAPGVDANLGFFGTGSETVFEVMSDNLGDGTSVGVVFTLIFAILGLLAPICLCLTKILKVKLPVGYIAFCFALFALLCGILAFCTKSFFLAGQAEGESVKLGAGAICTGIFSILNALTLGCYGVMNLKK